MKHKIEEVEFTRGNHSDTLCYIADGELTIITGEFFCDKQDVFHHRHVFSDGKEIEILF